MATLELPEQTLTKLKANAEARRMPLESYLESVAAADAVRAATKPSQLTALESFTRGMGDWVQRHVPSGHVVDDSRESIYPDRD